MSQTLQDIIGDNDIDELNDYGETRLITILQGFAFNDNEHFAYNDNDALALTLIRAGCNLDCQSKTIGTAAIHLACILGRIKVVVEMIERNVKLDARTDNDMTCFMLACQSKHYDCAFAVMDAGGTVNLSRRTLDSRRTYTIALPSLVMQGAKRRLREIDQVRESFKNWSPTIVEEEILPFIYCENNLKYLSNFDEPKETIQNVTKQGQKRKHSG